MSDFMPVTMQQHAAMQGRDVGHLAPEKSYCYRLSFEADYHCTGEPDCLRA